MSTLSHVRGLAFRKTTAFDREIAVLRGNGVDLLAGGYD